MVRFASFGTPPRALTCDGYARSPASHAGTSAQEVEARCQWANSCSVPATVAAFGEPGAQDGVRRLAVSVLCSEL